MRKNLLFILLLLAGGLTTINAQYVVFDDDIVAPGTTLSNANAGSVNSITTDDSFTGTSSLLVKFEGYPPAPQNWCMLLLSSSPAVDLTEYTEGYLNFALKTTSTSSFNCRITDGTNKPKIDFIDGLDPYGFIRDGEWHTVSIPVADMIALTPGLNMAAITDLFVWRSAAASGSGWDAVSPCEFYIDDISISTEPFKLTDVKNVTASNVNVFPNPATNLITVNGVTSLDANVLSITGQVVKSVKQNNNRLNVSDLSNGVYFLSLKSEGKTYIKKFVKN